MTSTSEVWVTTPRDHSIRILDAKTLVQKARLPFDGEPEGVAVDLARGRFYTNLEDHDLTLAIDLATHATVATWQPNCGEEGPHGLRFSDHFLFVACSAAAKVLDVTTGRILGTIETGDGVDDLDYAPATHLLYIAAAHAATLTIASVDAAGTLALYATVPTKAGARNAVVDASGTVYLADGPSGEILVATPSK